MLFVVNCILVKKKMLAKKCCKHRLIRVLKGFMTAITIYFKKYEDALSKLILDIFDSR